jgi:hypothetical protein
MMHSMIVWGFDPRDPGCNYQADVFIDHGERATRRLEPAMQIHIASVVPGSASKNVLAMDAGCRHDGSGFNMRYLGSAAWCAFKFPSFADAEACGAEIHGAHA